MAAANGLGYWVQTKECGIASIPSLVLKLMERTTVDA